MRNQQQNTFFKSADVAPNPVNNEDINIVFLDIDGVLLRSTDGHANKEAYHENLPFIQSKLGEAYKTLELYDIGATLRFSKEAVANLKSLCEKINAQIVISSAWRNPEDREKSLRRLRLLFKLWDLDQLIIDETPHLRFISNINTRAAEIQAWLDRYQNGRINSYVILDDIDLSREFPNNFVHTEDRMFFSEQHLEKALSIVQPPKSSGCRLDEMVRITEKIQLDFLNIMPMDILLHWLGNQSSLLFGFMLQMICNTSLVAASPQLGAALSCNVTRVC